MRSSGEEKEVAQFHTAGVAPKVTTTDTEELFGGLNWWPSLNKVASSSDPLSLSMPAHTFQHYWQNLRESEAVSDGWAPTASRLLRVSTVALNFIAAVSGHMEKERERERHDWAVRYVHAYKERETGGTPPPPPLRQFSRGAKLPPVGPLAITLSLLFLNCVVVFVHNCVVVSIVRERESGDCVRMGVNVV